ncbi:hypothetical protein LshimejAT787_0212600 [Lyophyllum shimeji]|uniref:Protein kinase domain-containing protein n=1 Tax=Lyophyllum shimeji TaxID=47721 RepID=A0A9P3ULJ0_LYOSH|nr:hypothetical protein LshimejAT787_0212600 [Lyophyllum shimeji]
MRFSSFLNIALLALFAVPATVALPVEAEDALYIRDVAHERAIEARQLLHNIIQERALDAEDAAVLEARILPILGALNNTSSVCREHFKSNLNISKVRSSCTEQARVGISFLFRTHQLMGTDNSASFSVLARFGLRNCVLFKAMVPESLPPLPFDALLIVFRHLVSFYTRKSCDLEPDEHFCSLSDPCRVAFSAFLAPILSLRLVSAAWNVAVSSALASFDPGNTSRFFKRVEDAYYPHPWHINTRVRIHVLLRRFRVYRTISSECADRGVYLAYDFGTSSGCLNAKTVIVKAWSAAEDCECVTERTVYNVLSCTRTSGIPDVLASAHDSKCEVYAIVLQRLGPTLDDVIQTLPDGKLDETMVLAVAIQMIDRYKDIHSRGVIHNGVKPANICLPPAPSHESIPRHPERSATTLFAIDFGLSSFLPPHAKLPGDRKEIVGNRSFLSVFGHHGISLSQRDDLESLAYLLSFLSHGRLPWTPPPLLLQKGAASKQPPPRLWRVKMATPASVLFRGMDSSFVEFWKDVKGLAFGEVPDYDGMRRRFEECWKGKGYDGRPGGLDWGAIFPPAPIP